MNADPSASAKRQLRAQIARCRRHIDAELRAVSDERRRLSDWRTYVARYPAQALAAAFAAGFALSAGRLGRWLGGAAVRAAVGSISDSLVAGLTTALRASFAARRSEP